MRNAIAWGVVCCTLFGAAIGLGSGIARAQAGPAMNANLVLDHGWQFRQVTADAKEGQNGWLSATVPGDVHLDLLANKKIADPYFRDNEAKLQWIQKESWEYKLIFEFPPVFLGRPNGGLFFRGLDTASKFFGNGRKGVTREKFFPLWGGPG